MKNINPHHPYVRREQEKKAKNIANKNVQDITYEEVIEGAVPAKDMAKPQVEPPQPDDSDKNEFPPSE